MTPVPQEDQGTAESTLLTPNSWAIDASDGSQSLGPSSPDSIHARIIAAA